MLNFSARGHGDRQIQRYFNVSSIASRRYNSLIQTLRILETLELQILLIPEKKILLDVLVIGLQNGNLRTT